MDLASFEALEAIVACPIHFGPLESPRILPCGHALCKTCLDAILSHNMARCPICKSDLGTAGDRPQCFALKQVSDLLTSQNSNNRAAGFPEASIDPSKPKAPHRQKPEKEICEKSVAMLRWNMAKMSSYRTNHEIPWAKENSQIGVRSMSTRCVSEDPDSSHLFFLNDRDNSVIRCSKDGTKSAAFLLQLRPEETFFPQFLKCSNGRIYVSGVLRARHKDPVGVLLLTGPDGAVLKRSLDFPFCLNSSGHPPVNGFDVDTESGEVAVACPSSHTIHLLAWDLEQLDSFIIDDPPMAPYFVTRSSNHLWVTCPHDGRILLINMPTGQLEYLFAEKIFDCVPSHIVRTTDDRIVVLDSQEPRVFWLQRTDQNMIAQRLDLGKELKEKHISSIGAASEEGILVVTRDGFFFLKPKRFPFHRKHPSLCVLL